MSVNSKLTALADEIRELSGTTGTMGLDTMKTHVSDANDTIDYQAELITQITSALVGKASGKIYATSDGKGNIILRNTGSNTSVDDGNVTISTYTDLPYLQVAGGQYINTGLSGAENYSFKYKAMNEQFDYRSGHILSNRTTFYTFAKLPDYSQNGISTCLLSNFKGQETHTYYDYDTTKPLTVSGWLNGNALTLELDGETIDTANIGTNIDSNPLYMFAYGGNVSDARYHFVGKFYYLKLFDANGTLVHYYKPVVRNDDGIKGVYDNVTMQFFPSDSGTNF